MNKRVLTVFYVLLAALLLYGNVQKERELKALHHKQEVLINNYVQNHQVCWYDAVESVELRDFEENSFTYFYDRLKDSVLYYENAVRIRKAVDKNADVVSAFYVSIIYHAYLSELSAYRGRVSELKDSEVFGDIKIIADWLKTRNENSVFEIYEDNDFKLEVTNELDSDFVKVYVGNMPGSQ